MQPSKNLVFDIETDGLYNEVTQGHCIVTYDLDTDEMKSFRPKDLEAGIEELESATCLIGHNIATYDYPVLEKLYPSIQLPEVLIDTLFVSRTMFLPTLRNADFRRVRAEGFPTEYINRYSLEAWGYRLGELKGDYGKNSDWSTFSEEMLSYCEQDVRVNVVLARFLRDFKRKGHRWSTRSFIIESTCARVIGEQERNGVGFNRHKAQNLYTSLMSERQKKLDELQQGVPPWEVLGERFTPKINNKRYGYQKGVPTRRPSKTVEFNPASNHHIAQVLREKHQWKPKAFGKDGQPKVGEEILSDLPWPIAKEILDYKLVVKRIGMLAEGAGAWLKVEKDGRIYGRVQPTGARTLRMSHFSPNLAQVPKVGKPHGAECRELFEPRPDWGWLVGADAAGLELRVLGNRLARWDNGVFGAEVVEGDAHSLMQEGTGIHLRDNQKTWTYAKLYGAFPYKLGTIIINDIRDAVEAGLIDCEIPHLKQAEKLGKKSERALMAKIPAFKFLLEHCTEAHKHGWVRLLDGRWAKSASEHSCLNTMCQGDGAVIMKLAQVHLRQSIAQLKLKPSEDYGWCLTVHDEWQLEARTEDIATSVGVAACDAIVWAGKFLNMRVPLAGEFKIGHNWAETH